MIFCTDSFGQFPLNKAVLARGVMLLHAFDLNNFWFPECWNNSVQALSNHHVAKFAIQPATYIPENASVACTIHRKNCFAWNPSIGSGRLKSRHHWLVQPLAHRKLTPLIQQTIPEVWSLGHDEGRERRGYIYSCNIWYNLRIYKYYIMIFRYI